MALSSDPEPRARAIFGHRGIAATILATLGLVLYARGRPSTGVGEIVVVGGASALHGGRRRYRRCAASAPVPIIILAAKSARGVGRSCPSTWQTSPGSRILPNPMRPTVGAAPLALLAGLRMTSATGPLPPGTALALVLAPVPPGCARTHRQEHGFRALAGAHRPAGQRNPISPRSSSTCPSDSEPAMTCMAGRTDRRSCGRRCTSTLSRSASSRVWPAPSCRSGYSCRSTAT